MCSMCNRNIGSHYLHKDGLHMIDRGKTFLADNCILADIIVYLNNIFLETHTPSTKIFF